jgi:streptomycin 6-kinase
VITVPAQLVRWRTEISGEAGRVWLHRLPHRVQELCDAWQLTLDDTPPMAGTLNLVLLVTRRDRPYALRVCWPEHDLTAEVTALRTWAGRGAVGLVEVHPDGDAILLERLDHRRTLGDLPLSAAAPLVGHLLDVLAVPAPPGLPLLAASARSFTARAGVDNARLGHPVPERWLTRAFELAGALVTDQNLLVHGDLHWGNVLADSAGGWRAIDPKPMAGDPASSVPELMWTRADESPTAADLRWLLHAVARAAGLDAERAAGWTVVRAVDYWLWGLDHGLTEDPRRCARLLDAFG